MGFYDDKEFVESAVMASATPEFRAEHLDMAHEMLRTAKRDEMTNFHESGDPDAIAKIEKWIESLSSD